MQEDRIAWVQCARGMTISLVVFGHMLYGVDGAVGIEPTAFLYADATLAMFRMPLFFLVAGIFASRTLARPPVQILNRTILHLVWIYLVWSLIHWAIKVPFGSLGNSGMDPFAILRVAYSPTDVLWFLYVLVIFFLVTWALRGVPGLVLVALAATIAAAPYEIEPKWIQRASNFYVFFVMGYVGSQIFIERARAFRPFHALLLVPGFAAFALGLVATGLWKEHTLWFMGQMLGILAMISLCVAVAETAAGSLLRFLGEYSLPIFVGHTIVGPTTRVLLHKGGITSDPTILVAVCTVVAIAGPMAMAVLADRLGAPWLFRKPGWFSLRLGNATELRRDEVRVGPA